MHAASEHAHWSHTGAPVVNEAARNDQLREHVPGHMGEATKRSGQAGLSLQSKRVKCSSTWSISSGADFCDERARIAGAEWQRVQWRAELEPRSRAPLCWQALRSAFAGGV